MSRGRTRDGLDGADGVSVPPEDEVLVALLLVVRRILLVLVGVGVVQGLSGVLVAHVLDHVRLDLSLLVGGGKVQERGVR